MTITETVQRVAKAFNKNVKIKYTPSFFYARDMQVVEACDVLLCFWDGVSTGTNFTRKYALKFRRRVEVFMYEQV